MVNGAESRKVEITLNSAVSHVPTLQPILVLVAHNVLRLGAVPHITNLNINHCILSGIALNRCWAQLIFKRNG